MKIRISALVPIACVLVLVAACAVDVEGPTGESHDALTGTDQFIVILSAPAGAAAVEAAGGRVARDLPSVGGLAAELPIAAIAGLRRNPNIELIELDADRHPMAQETPFGITAVQADLFLTAGDTPPLVCIIDSGFYLGHEDLQTDVTGWTESDEPWFEDACGHGSHVAGTIAALDNDTGVVGVFRNGVPLHIVKVFEGGECGWVKASRLVEALAECEAAAEAGGFSGVVVNMSLGGPVPTRTEERAFAEAYGRDVLSIAAAGNDGNDAMHYPSCYDAVVSVGAVDESNEIASFSQYNEQTELAAPGVAVLSSVPWIATNTLTVGSDVYEGAGMHGSIEGSASGPLAFGGLCNSDDSDDSDGSWDGAVVLCERGDIAFSEKVTNAQDGGAVAVIVYNSEPGGFSGTLGDMTSDVPAMTMDQEMGQLLVLGGLSDEGEPIPDRLGEVGAVMVDLEQPASGYELFSGTSMATPHVTGVAALVWSYYPDSTAGEIREALNATAADLGEPGRDVYFGNGLVQAADAHAYLSNPPAPCVPEDEICDDGVDNDCDRWVDSGDPDCFSCVELGGTCLDDEDCCEGKCKGRPGFRTCS